MDVEGWFVVSAILPPNQPTNQPTNLPLKQRLFEELPNLIRETDKYATIMQCDMERFYSESCGRTDGNDQKQSW